MTLFMARIAERDAVIHIIAQIRIKRISLDMMGAKYQIFCTAILTGKLISLNNRLSPFDHLRSVSRGRCMLSKIGARRIELRGNHCSPAFMRTENVTVSSLVHFLNVRRIAENFLLAKGARHRDFRLPETNICTGNGAVILLSACP